MKHFRVELADDQVEQAEAHLQAIGYKMDYKGIKPDCLYTFVSGGSTLIHLNGENSVDYPEITFEDFMQLTKEDVQ